MWFAYDPRMNSDHSLNLDHSRLHKTEQIDKASTTLLRIYGPSFTRTLKVPHKTLFAPIVQNRMKAKILAMRFALVRRSAEKANKFRRGGREGWGGERTIKGTRSLAIAYSKIEMGSVELSCKGGRKNLTSNNLSLCQSQPAWPSPLPTSAVDPHQTQSLFVF